MTTVERAQRNAGIAAARAAGRSWREVASEFGISASQARQVVVDQREAQGPRAPVLDVDPNAVIAEVVGVHQWAMAQLRTLAASADNDSARVGAAKGAAAVGGQLVALLARAGLLPDAPEWRRLREVHEMAEAILRAADRLGIEASAFEQAWAAEPRLPAIRLGAAA